MNGPFGSLASLVQRKAQILDQLPSFLLGQESRSGVAVNWFTALQVTAMLACCKVVAEDIAQCRCRLMRPRANGVGADEARDHPLFTMLGRRPNSWQTAFEFWETIVFHIMLVGNAYVYVSRLGDRVIELLIIEPGKVRVTRRSDLSLHYEVTADDGAVKTIDAAEMWHIRGPSWNGWMGMEGVRLAREAIGLALVLEGSHARQHKDGLKIPGSYSVEGTLSPEKHAALLGWLKQHASANSGDPLILDHGAKWFGQQMSGVDAEHLGTRRFQIEEICRAVRVMPIMVGLTDKVATYASAEQMFLAHGVYTLGPWAERLEGSADVALLSEAEQQQGLYFKFNLSAKMRGDYKSRQEGLQIQRRNGVINADEWRALEDLNPRDDDGGKQYIVEGNMAVQDGRDLTPVKHIVT